MEEKCIAPVWPKFIKSEEIFKGRLHHLHLYFRRIEIIPPLTIRHFNMLGSSRLSWRLGYVSFAKKPVFPSLLCNSLTLVPWPSWYAARTHQCVLNAPLFLLVSRCQASFSTSLLLPIVPGKPGEETGEMSSNYTLMLFLKPLQVQVLPSKAPCHYRVA